MCTLSASALSYASPYRGAGRNGYIHTSAPMRSSMTTHSAMAQAPVATMSSTSAYGTSTSKVANGNYGAVRTLCRTTYATTISACGTNSAETYSNISASHLPASIGARRNEPPFVPSVADCGCHDDNGDGRCDVCDQDMSDIHYDGCEHLEEDGYCWCPLDFNWAAALFMTALAVVYAIYKKRTCTLQ